MEEKLARVKAELREILDRYSRNPAAEDGERIAAAPAEPRNDSEDGMTAEREGRILEGAIAKWGPELQTDVAIEEMAELTQALLKYRRAISKAPSGNVPAVVMARLRIREEMADVSIMLRQLELIYGGYADEKILKLERLERMVQE